MSYDLVLAYHDRDRVRFVPVAKADDRNRLRPLLRAIRSAHRDVRAGRANIAIRKVGQS